MCMPISSSLRAQVDQIKLNGSSRENFEKELVNATKDGDLNTGELAQVGKLIQRSPENTQKLSEILVKLTDEAEKFMALPNVANTTKVELSKAVLDNLLGVSDSSKRIGNSFDNSTNRTQITKTEEQITGLSKSSLTQALNTIAQVDDTNDTDFDENRCCASSLVGAAMLNGQEGLKSLVTFLQSKFPAGEDERNFLDNLNSNLKDSSQISKYDISKLQELTHKYLKSVENAIPNITHSTGVNQIAMEHVITNESTIRGLLTSANANLSLIDTNGDQNPNHYVLEFRGSDGKPKVYDPYPQKDGNQVKDEPATLKDYAKASFWKSN